MVFPHLDAVEGGLCAAALLLLHLRRGAYHATAGQRGILAQMCCLDGGDQWPCCCRSTEVLSADHGLVAATLLPLVGPLQQGENTELYVNYVLDVRAVLPGAPCTLLALAAEL
jgi:hypothetical protein